MFGRSFFGGPFLGMNPLMREMTEDPFFASHQAHLNHMNSLFSMHNSLLGGPTLDPFSRSMELMPHSAGSLALANPFGMMFGRPDSMMQRMQEQFGASSNNCHSFSSSSFMSYSNTGNGPPRVYQASSQTRQAPGGIRETRKTERDSESGTQKVSVGHHIQDRGHVIERTRTQNGDLEEENNFYNIDEEEAEAFNSEWMERTNHPRRGISNRNHRAQLALPYYGAEGHNSSRRRHQRRTDS